MERTHLRLSTLDISTHVLIGCDTESEVQGVGFRSEQKHRGVANPAASKARRTMNPGLSTLT